MRKIINDIWWMSTDNNRSIRTNISRPFHCVQYKYLSRTHCTYTMWPLLMANIERRNEAQMNVILLLLWLQYWIRIGHYKAGIVCNICWNGWYHLILIRFALLWFGLMKIKSSCLYNYYCIYCRMLPAAASAAALHILINVIKICAPVVIKYISNSMMIFS